MRRQTAVVSMSPGAVLHAWLAAQERYIGNARRGIKPKHGAPTHHDGSLSANVIGCLGEVAYAVRYECLDEWIPYAVDFKAIVGDVGKFVQVRSTSHEDGRLLTHGEDDGKPWQVFIVGRVNIIDVKRLMANRMPCDVRVTLGGWAWQEDLPGISDYPGPHIDRPAYYLDNRLLEPMSTVEEAVRLSKIKYQDMVDKGYVDGF